MVPGRLQTPPRCSHFPSPHGSQSSPVSHGTSLAFAFAFAVVVAIAAWIWRFSGMENLEVLVRGVVMQNPGVGLPRSVSFQGVELLWVVVVATIVLAVVSVTRVSVVSVGWTWGSKPGHVRVRVQSFSSLADAAIAAAGGMFSAEIVNCSADSCSEAASSSADCGSERAEMVFIFNDKGASLVKTTTTTTTALPSQQTPAAVRAPPEKSIRKRSALQEFQKQEAPLVSTPQPCYDGISFPRREGIEWNASPACAPSLATPVAYGARPLPSRVVKNTSSAWDPTWDPLLKLRIRDTVMSDGRRSRPFSRSDFTLPLAPVAIHGSSSAVTLEDDVVRVWDCDSKSLMTSVRLSKGCGDAASAFDVDWESKIAAMTTTGSIVSIANLESAAYEERYHTQQPVVQAIHLSRTPSPKTMFTGGPAAANPGCSVSVWDCRSSSRQLTVNLSAAVTIYGIYSHGQELHVRDATNSLAAHDVRMLGVSPVSRIPCDLAPLQRSTTQWWDIDTSTFKAHDDDDDDDDDDFFDCLMSEEIGASHKGRSFVTALSRSFSLPKAPSGLHVLERTFSCQM